MKPNYRRCLSCRRVDVKNNFWRVVRVHPSLEVQLDLGQGRSAYICRQESCLKTAAKKNRLGRALKASVPEKIHDTLFDRQQKQDTATSNAVENFSKSTL